MTEDEQEILKEIIVTEEEVNQRLKSQVSKAKKFIKIEDKSGRVSFELPYGLSNTEKICLLLIGKYFAHRAGIINSNMLSMRQISEELGIPITTVSAPLGNSVKEGDVNKTNDGLYGVNQYKMESILDELNTKHSKRVDTSGN